MNFSFPKFFLASYLFNDAASDTLDCSAHALLEGLPVLGGASVIHKGQLWRADWWQGVLPGPNISGWTLLGTCDPIGDTICSHHPWDAGATYAVATSVIYKEGVWRNSWYATPGVPPDQDRSGNWKKLHDCSHNTPADAESTLPTTLPTSTTPQTTTTDFPFQPTRPAPIATTTTTLTTTTTVPTITTVPTTTTTTTLPTTTTTVQTTTTTQRTTTDSPFQPRQTSKAVASSTNALVGTTVLPRVAPTGPTGPNGECVWPAWTKQSYRTGQYVTVGNKVYTPKYWAPETSVPPAEPWTEVVTCTGQAPKSEWTKEELLAQIDPNGQRYQQILDPWTPLMPDDATIVQTESKLRSESEASKVVILNTVLNAEEVERIQPGRTENPANVRLVESIVTPQLFSQLFPVRTHEYTYVALLRAIGAFPAYCQVYQDGRDSDKICRKLLATSFAHFTQEVGANHGALFYKAAGHDAEHTNADSDAYFPTGQQLQKWQQALWFVREMGFTESTFSDVYREACSIAGANRQWGLNFQCYDNTMYFGRGSKQLTHSYNYGLFSLAMFGDSSYLLKNPGLVADSWLNFASAVWFAVTPQNPKPAMIQVVDHSWVPNDVDKKNGMTNGFAATNDIINGGLECRGSNKQAIINRVEFYKQFSNLLGVPVPADEVVDCNGLGGFQAGSAGGVKTYLTRSWQSIECVLTTEQTAFRITTPGDYGRCVNWHFRSQWVDKITGEIVASYGNEPGSRP